MRPLVLIRPEPGLSASAERAHRLGLDVVEWPLFRVEPVDWAVPDAATFDAILFTSANAVRAAGSGLSQLFTLPVYAVGSATAAAAAQAGFQLAGVGDDNIDAVLRLVPEQARLLHLVGQDHVRATVERSIRKIIVYRSVLLDNGSHQPAPGSVIAVHSSRAGARLAELIVERGTSIIVAISDAAAWACGEGWARIEVADQPNDEALLSLAATLCQTSAP